MYNFVRTLKIQFLCVESGEWFCHRTRLKMLLSEVVLGERIWSVVHDLGKHGSKPSLERKKQIPKQEGAMYPFVVQDQRTFLFGTLATLVASAFLVSLSSMELTSSSSSSPSASSRSTSSLDLFLFDEGETILRASFFDTHVVVADAVTGTDAGVRGATSSIRASFFLALSSANLSGLLLSLVVLLTRPNAPMLTFTGLDLLVVVVERVLLPTWVEATMLVSDDGCWATSYQYVN